MEVLITPEIQHNIAAALLAEAKNDDFILDLLSGYGISEEQYVSLIDEAEAELQSSKDTLQGLKMKVYVDSSGFIRGRTLTSDASADAFEYIILNDKGYFEYNVSVTDNTGAKVLDVTGNNTLEKEANSGKATLTVLNPADSENFVLDFTYEDLHSRKEGNRSYQYGSMKLSTLDPVNLEILLNNNVVDDVQITKLELKLDAKSLLTLTATSEYIQDYTVTAPPADAVVFDLTQADAYAATINIADYISYLSEQLGVDLEGLMGLFLPSAVY